VLSDLAEDLPDRPTQLLKTASESLTRLERLISDVLDAAVSGRARSTLRLSDLDLVEVLRGLAPALSAAAFKRGLRLSVEIPKGLPKIAGDREKVERLVTNLVDHSLKRVPRGGADVKLVASSSDGRAIVKVVDLGPALSVEKAAHLFDDVGSARGTGEFGLSVARRLADAMDATLTAYAEADGSNVKSVAWTISGREADGPRA
jgi:signal transduction histidine kinase